MMRAPMMEPRMVPEPPFRLAPPMMTAAMMSSSRLRLGDPTVAVGLELDIIAAVIIGGASLNGGSGTILGSVIGALIMSVLRNGSQQMGWPNYFQEIIIGAVIIVAVFLDRFRRGAKS